MKNLEKLKKENYELILLREHRIDPEDLRVQSVCEIPSAAETQWKREVDAAGMVIPYVNEDNKFICQEGKCAKRKVLSL
jgi:hypothetical protein